MREKLEKPYDPRQCQSLLGYAAQVHERSGGVCQLCEKYGASEVDFHLWRQLTVEHLIGESEGGYKREILKTLKRKFPKTDADEIKKMMHEIDRENTVTACHFCNSATSHHPTKTLEGLINETNGDPREIKKVVHQYLLQILEEKRKLVRMKLDALEKVFGDEIKPRLIEARRQLRKK